MCCIILYVVGGVLTLLTSENELLTGVLFQLQADLTVLVTQTDI